MFKRKDASKGGKAARSPAPAAVAPAAESAASGANSAAAAAPFAFTAATDDASSAFSAPPVAAFAFNFAPNAAVDGASDAAAAAAPGGLSFAPQTVAEGGAHQPASDAAPSSDSAIMSAHYLKETKFSFGAGWWSNAAGATLTPLADFAAATAAHKPSTRSATFAKPNSTRCAIFTGFESLTEKIAEAREDAADGDDEDAEEQAMLVEAMKALQKGTNADTREVLMAGLANNLSSITLALIFQFLESPDLLRSNRACRQWREAAVSPLVLRPAIKICMDDWSGIEVSGPQISFTATQPMKLASESKLFRNLRIVKIQDWSLANARERLMITMQQGSLSFERLRLERLELLTQFHSLHTLQLEWNDGSKGMAAPTHAEIARMALVLQSPALRHLKVLKLSLSVPLVQLFATMLQHLTQLEMLDVVFCAPDSAMRPLVSHEGKLVEECRPIVIAEFWIDLPASSGCMLDVLARHPSLKALSVAADCERTVTSCADLDALSGMWEANPALSVSWCIPLQLSPGSDLGRELKSRPRAEWPTLPQMRHVHVSEWDACDEFALDVMQTVFPNCDSLLIASLSPSVDSATTLPFPESLSSRLVRLEIDGRKLDSVPAVTGWLLSCPRFESIRRFHLKTCARSTNQRNGQLMSVFTRMPVLTDLDMAQTYMFDYNHLFELSKLEVLRNVAPSAFGNLVERMRSKLAVDFPHLRKVYMSANRSLREVSAQPEAWMLQLLTLPHFEEIIETDNSGVRLAVWSRACLQASQKQQRDMLHAQDVFDLGAPLQFTL